MKTAIIAFASVLALSPAAFANFDEMESGYVAGAFDSADDDWRRLMANNYSYCGSYGNNNNRRIDILIDRYQKLGDALEAGDRGAASEAAKSLSSAIHANSRFEQCWDKIAGKEGIGRSFKRNLEKL